MSWVRTQYIQGRLDVPQFSRNISEFVLDYLCDPLVKSPERDFGWTCFGAEIAVNASAGHVDSSGEVKHGVLRGQISRPNEGVFFERAYVAETDGADVSAAVTLDTLVKLGQPVLQSIGNVFCQDTFHSGVGNGFSLFSGYEFIRKRFAALVHVCKLLGTSNPHSYDPVLTLNLIPSQEFIQGALVASSQEHSYRLFRIL